MKLNHMVPWKLSLVLLSLVVGGCGKSQATDNPKPAGHPPQPAASAQAAPSSQSVPMTVPPEAKPLVEKGLAATEQQEWSLAFRYFEEARKLAPVSPPILFNLALAHAKAGHELAAIAHLQSYLAAAPNAPNAEVVRREITKLEIAVEGKTQKILQEALNAARVQDENYWVQNALMQVAGVQAGVGDLEGATKTLEEAKTLGEVHEWQEVRLWAYYGERMAKTGDLNTAQEALQHVPASNTDRDMVLHAMFEVLAEQGNAKQARHVAKQITAGSSERQRAFGKLLEQSIAEGDFVPVEEALPTLDVDGRTQLLRSVVAKQIELKDLDGARQTANRIEQNKPKGQALADVVMAHVEQEDLVGAKAPARDIQALAPEAVRKDLIKRAAAFRQAEAGEIYEAVETASAIQQLRTRVETVIRIADIQEALGDTAGAKQTQDQAYRTPVEEGIFGDLDVECESLAIAETVLGNHDAGRTFAQCVELLLSSFHPSHLRQPRYTRILPQMASIQAKLGQGNEVEETARVAAAQPIGPYAGDAEEGIALMRLEQGDISGAMEAVAKTKYNIKRWLLYNVVQAQIKAGDLAAAEQTIARISFQEEDEKDMYERRDWHRASAKVESLLALAEAYAGRGNQAEAVRLLSAASQTVMTTMKLKSEEWYKEALNASLEKIAAAQAQVGDAAGAHATRSHLSVSQDLLANAPPGVAEWLKRASLLAVDPTAIDLEGQLEKAGTEGFAGGPTDPHYVPDRIAQVAKDLDRLLLELRALDRKLAKPTSPPDVHSR